LTVQPAGNNDASEVDEDAASVARPRFFCAVDEEEDVNDKPSVLLLIDGTPSSPVDTVVGSSNALFVY
jgi:hypothetical protein